MRYHSSDEKARPLPGVRRTFQSKACRPCARLSFWFHWDDQIVDIRNIRMHFGLPSESAADYARTPLENFHAHVAQLRTLVRKQPFRAVVERSESLRYQYATR